MLRIDKLAGILKEASVTALEQHHVSLTLMLTTEDGACLATSENQDLAHTLGAAAASIFQEFRAAESSLNSPLTDFVYKSEERILCCRQLATLQDNYAVLLIVACDKTGFTVDSLKSYTARAAEDLAFLNEPLSQMSKKYSE